MSTKKPRPMCTRRAWCTSLTRHLGPSSGRPAGLAPFVLLDMNTGKDHCYGVIFRKRGGERGVLINRCPWCGCNVNFIPKSWVVKS